MKDQDRVSNEKEMVKDTEIDLLDLLKTLWSKRGIVLKTIIIFTLFGLFVALFSEKEYEASTTMVPQIDNQPSTLGGLSSLASLAGFDMDMNAGAIAAGQQTVEDVGGAYSMRSSTLLQGRERLPSTTGGRSSPSGL